MSNLLCDIFGHSPRTEYNAELSGYSNCWHRTRCRRCGMHLDTPSKKHEWTEETLASPCQTQKKCRNCGYTSGPFTEHNFDTTHPLREGCAVFITCTRCGEKSVSKFEHLYADELLLQGCTGFHVCQRCGQRDAGAPAHAFGEPQQDGCVVSHTCTRCGKQEVVKSTHQFIITHHEEHEYAHMLTSRTTLTCQKCGEMQVKEDQRYTDW